MTVFGFALGVCLGIVSGLTGTLFNSISGVLMSLALPLSLVLGADCGLGYIISFRAITSVSGYLSLLGQAEVGRKSLSEKGKALAIATQCAKIHWDVKVIVSIIAMVASLVMVHGNLLAPGAIIMPLSIIVMGIGWVCYIVTRKTWKSRLKHMLVVLMLVGMALGATKLHLLNATMPLFLGLYSMRGMLTDSRTRIGAQRDKAPATAKMDSWSALLSGVFSATLIGFPGSNITKLLGGSEEISNTYRGAIVDAVAEVLGLLFFFVQGSSRDTFTTILGMVLGTSLQLSLYSFIPVMLLSLVITAWTISLLPILAKWFISIHNNNLKNPLFKPLIIAVNLIGLSLICGGFWAIVAVLSIGFALNFLMTELSIHPEFNGVLLTILPFLGFFHLL